MSFSGILNEYLHSGVINVIEINAVSALIPNGHRAVAVQAIHLRPALPDKVFMWRFSQNSGNTSRR
jgi:hypothetical protein